MTAVAAFRLLFFGIMIVMAIIMWRNAANTAKLLKQGQDDKKAREQALLDLRKTADELAHETHKAVEQADKQRESLSLKMDKNTELTMKAVEVASVAAEVAKGVDEKLTDTNKLLEDKKKGE